MRQLRRLTAHVLLFSLIADPAVMGLQAAARNRNGGAADLRPVVRPGGAGLSSFAAPATGSAEANAAAATCAENLSQHRAPLVSLIESLLWPPDHQLIDVGLGVNVTAPCEGQVTTRVAVFADEPDEDQTGDGNVPGDARIDGTSLYLRSERKGNSDGRVYLILATSTLPDGTSGTACATALVPQSRSKAALASGRVQAAAAQTYCEEHQAPPPAYFPLAEGTLSLANLPPVVDAGADQAIDFPGSAALHGTATDDGRPNGTLAVSWSKVSGPDTVTFSPPGTAETTVSFGAAGTYTLRLTANDGQLTASDETVVVVSVANEAPQVEAGPDQEVTLPEVTVALAGVATDDGRPAGSTLAAAWSVESPAGAAVSFTDPGSPQTAATLPGAGEYVLRLTADDGQLTASDTVRMTVHAQPPPVLSLEDAAVSEGHEGTTAAVVTLALSYAWTQPVSVDYLTEDGTAAAGCDYRTAFGTVTFAPGETTAEILVPIAGELVPEADETVRIRVDNVRQATLARTEALITIRNDDDANAPPGALSGRAPADRAHGIALPPTLTWSAVDPDAGDVLTHDVHFGTAFATSGQSWARTCPANPGPGPRTAPVTGYDEAGDRLFLFGGTGGEGASDGSLWLLAPASAAGGPPRWTSIPTSGGPVGLSRAASAYDPATNRLFVFGGCSGDCLAGSDQTWVLANANGLGGTPVWSLLPGAGPGPRLDAAAAIDPGTRRLIVFGGSDAGGAFGDVWLLNLDGPPAWQELPAGGAGPARSGMTASYDGERNVLVVFGGRSGTQAFRDTWVLSHANGSGGGASWTRLAPAGAVPPARWGHVAAYDPVTSRLVVYGGSTASANPATRFVFRDAWMLTGASGAGVAEWIPLSPNAGPAGQVQAAGAFSASENRLVVIGGASNPSPATDEIWVLSDAAGTLPLVSSETATSLTADGLAPGAEYFWRIVSRDGHGAARGSAVWRFTSNAPPLVDAGPDREIRLPDGVSLSGTVSDDGLPVASALALHWSASGPGPVAFSSPDSAATTASFTAAGTYVLTLTATDGMFSASDTLTVAVTVAAPAVCAALPTLPVGWWQGEGDTDDLGGGQPALAQGGVGFAPGVVGQAFVFDGVDDAVVADASPRLNVASLTLEGWVKLGTLSRPEPLIEYSEASRFVGVHLWHSFRPNVGLSPGTLYANVTDPNGGSNVVVSAPGVLKAGEWTHVALTYDFATGRAAIYANGVAVGSATLGSFRILTAWKLNLGFRPAVTNGGGSTASRFTGSLDEMAVYNRALSASEIRAIVDAGLAGKCAGANRPPVVDAGPDRSATLRCDGTAVATLPGSVTDDGLPVGAALTAAWSSLNGPAAVTFSPPNAATTDARFPATGDYTLRLVGSDTALAAQDVAVLHVSAFLPPSGRFVGSGIIPSHNGQNGQAVVTVPGLTPGRIYSLYLWGSWAYGNGAIGNGTVDNTLVSGFGNPTILLTASTAPFTSTAPMVIRRFEATAPSLTFAVQDLAGFFFDNVGQLFFQIYEGVPGEPLVVDAGADQTLLQPVSSATLTASVTDAGLPPIAPPTFSWTQASGPAAVIASPAAATTSVALSQQGTYVFRVRATSCVRTVQDEVTVVVAERPDLLAVSVDASGLTVDGQTLAAGGTVSGQVTNGGGTAAAFEATFFEDRDGDGGFDPAVDGLLGTTAVASLNPGQTATASAAVSGSVQFAGSPVHVFVDSGRAVAETDESNNHARSGGASLQPDLTASFVRSAESGGSLLLTARIGNGGGSTVPAGVPVSFYDRNPATGGTLLATGSTSGALAPGRFEDVPVTVPATTVARPLWVVADDAGGLAGTIDESDESNNAYDSRQFLSPTANLPPTVDAGPDQRLLPPQTTAVLDATVTDDGQPLGSELAVQWSQLQGPGTAVFGNAAAVDTTVTFDQEGRYVLRLSASDSAASGSDTVAIDVAFTNAAPVVNAGPDRTLALPAETLTLTGTATDDGLPIGSTMTFQWVAVVSPGVVTFGTPTALETAATFSDPGLYTLRLTASDGAQQTSDTVNVSVGGTAPVGNAPQVALTAPLDGARVSSPTPVVGSATSDSLASWKLEYRLEGDTSYTRFAAGTTPVTTGPLGTFDPSLLLNGLYEIRLTATDTAGRSSRISVQVVVKDNLKVGQFTVSFHDLDVPVSGLPIQVRRTYDSRDKGKGDFGIGWRLEMSHVRLAEKGAVGLAFEGVRQSGFFPTYCLQLARPQVVTVTLTDGTVYEFQPALTRNCQQFVPIQDANVTYQPLPGTHATLTAAGDGYVFVEGSWPGPMELYDGSSFEIYDPEDYVLTLPGGTQLFLHQTTGLRQVKDLNGNTLTVTAGGITHSSGRGITFTRDAQGRITRITDPDNHAMTYGYDAAGDLVSFTDRETHTTTFTYDLDQPHLLETIKDPRGKQPIRNEYYDDGRIKSHTDAFGKTITYAHDLTGRQEVITDRDGGVRVLEFDERGNVVRETNPEGKVVDRTFDARNNRRSETLPHDPGVTNAPKTEYFYDAQDDLRSVTDPENNVTEYTYNARKQVVLMKDPRGTYTLNAYDAKGNLFSTKTSTSPTGSPVLSEITSTYRTDGNLETHTEAVDGVACVTRYEYDGSGYLTKETDGLGHQMSSTYDARGNRLTQTTTRTTPGGIETLTATYEYDKLGRLLKITDPDTTFTTTVYDEAGRQKETHDKLGRVTRYDYDDMGRLVLTTYPDLTTEEATYDGEGRRLTSKDRAGRVTKYKYDALGRPTRTTYPDETFTENVYNSAGRLKEAKDARGNTTLYGYDNAGRQTSVKVPLGNDVFAETRSTYDENGNLKTVRDANLHTVTFEYDKHNRRTKTIFPDETYQETTYDPLGRRRVEQDQAGKRTKFDYDCLGRLVKVTQHNDGVDLITHYEYDEVGNRVLQRDAKGHETRFEYDKLGRETARTLPDGKTESKTYWPTGSLKTRTDFIGRTTSYDYNENEQLSTRTYPAGTLPAESFTYTPTGQRKTVTVAGETTQYEYDLRNRLKVLSYPDGRTLEYDYDGNGNRTMLKATAGGQLLTTFFLYDPANRLDVVTDPAGRTYDHGYDPAGNRTSLAHPNGVTTAYIYDDLNRLRNLATTRPASGVTIQSYGFTLGLSGNRTKITEGDGTVRDYGYDDLYRLTSETVAIGALPQYEKAFTYDNVGNRLTQTTNGAGAAGTPLAAGALTYAYDTRDRLESENGTLAGQPVGITYGYDDNGNLITKSGEATYVWDVENRLIRAETGPSGSTTIVTYAYDADGNRVQVVVTPPTGPPTATNYLVDTSGSLSHVVAETDNAGALEAYYVRGDDLLAIMRPLVPAPAAAADWQTRFYHADGIGSVRRLTDENGAITDGYTYTAFGEQIAHTGTDPQPYAFAGEPYDPNVGFQYHRARWMDPRVGRFTSSDPFAGVAYEPLSLHRYIYGAADPVDRSDPTGLFVGGLLEASVVAHIQSTLAQAQVSFGFAVGNQILYGGNAGLKSLLIDAAMVAGGALVIYSIWRLISRLANPRTPALQEGRQELLKLLQNRARRVAGLREGRPIIVDNSLGVVGGADKVAETLRAHGYNARSVNEIFGVDPGDPAILKLLEAVDGRIVASDRGANGEGFRRLRIKVPNRVRNVESVLRIVEEEGFE